MKRIVFILGVWSVLAFSFAIAHPARPLYEPIPIPKPPAPKLIPNMAGTTWFGKYNAIDRVYVFEFDGTVSYTTAAAAKAKVKIIPNKGRGNWRMEGTTFFFEHNLGAGTVMEFRGNFAGPDTIVGEQHMVKTGKKSNVTMKRHLP
jgi:hypothetical protein